tara:strand:- start:12030 stop:13169 length:1140 start_codon:yes stop_codon:yes gene_type:complete
MKIIILGGDGFCGWPTALKLAKDHEVIILDNFVRRRIDEELETKSLTNIASIKDRLETAEKLGFNLRAFTLDVAKDYKVLKNYIRKLKPDAIVHFAEQRSAPYSMISDNHRSYTVDNNINATHNILNAIVESKRDIHLIHLGTMGVYGYSKEFGCIPEGYLNVRINSTNNDTDILYPTNPGSVYHMTKSLDQLLFQFYVKNWGLKITDLHQGIVWGTQTEETMLDDNLVNRFDYDGVFGTVLNRFISQAATGNSITVYGTGGQKRAFIHIQDTANCVKIAAESPADGKQVRIFNQVAEVKSVRELADMCAETYNGKVINVNNPRKELAENELEVSNVGLRSLGFEPIKLNAELINDVHFIASKMKSNFDKSKILTSPLW